MLERQPHIDVFLYPFLPLSLEINKIFKKIDEGKRGEWREGKRVRERETYISLFFHLFMCSLVDSCALTGGLNPTLVYWDDALTS